MVLGTVTYARGEQLSDQDQRDLESYFRALRHYYAIPASRPVFPTPQRRADRPKRPVRRSRQARNRANHPWRASLGGVDA